MKEQPKFMVCVRCFTFNQVNYITDTMNGFTMQETTFPFVCTIVDDASTDGEQENIRKYLQEHLDLEDKTIARNEETNDYFLTFACHKSNKNCFFAVLFLKHNHYGNISMKRRKLQYTREWDNNAKYIASCEGDDYWTDNHRLQKLVGFLETHPKYVLACHRINRYIQEKCRLVYDNSEDIYFGNKQGVSFGRYYNRFVNWKTQTLATVYRQDVLTRSVDNYPHAITDGIKSYFPLKYGKGFCFNEYMATYRVNQGGVWSRLSKEDQLYSNWKMFRNFDQFDKTLFSKLSYLESYHRLMKSTGRKGYKDAEFKTQVYIFGKIYTPLRRMITLYYKIRFKLKK